MERADPALTRAPTRRDLRLAANAAAPRPARRSTRPTTTRTSTPRGIRARWIPRVALLCSLAGITVVVPLTGTVSPATGMLVADAQAAQAALPTTVDAVAAVTVETLPPPAITASGATATRADVAASRSEERDPLPGCDGSSRAPGENGQLRTSDLCTLWDGVHQLRGDAASSLAELDLAFRARFGRDLCVTDAYRTLAEQRVLKSTKGGLAAVPGRSNHGWGLAIDLCSNETRGEGWTWITENGAIYGWENPAWALSGGSGPHEPWHWEYTRGVEEDGEYYTS